MMQQCKKVIALMLFVIMIFSLAGCGREEINDGKAAMPMSAQEMENLNYEDVVTKLHIAGFTNVCSEPMNDLLIGLFNKDGEVEDVSVNGEKGFKKDQRFDINTYIIVRYHSFPGSKEASESVKPDEEQVYADTSDGMTEIPICSDDIKELTVEKVEDILTQAGFINIKKEPLGDLVIGLFHSEGEIKEVTIGGDLKYSKGDRFYPDVKIVIRYHSYS